MKALIFLACTGCATTWALTQATDTQRIWDERVHEVRVPQPGVVERLTVDLPLGVEHEPADPKSPGEPPAQKPFALACSIDQQAHDVVYHQAFRYGSTWKKGTAAFFAIEAGLAALTYFTADAPGNAVYGGALAIDAAATGVLFFLPREEIYRHDDAAITTAVRADCPDGLQLAVGDTAYPVNAAGKLDELGSAALDEWMRTPTGPLELRISGIRQELPITEDGRCTWLRERDHESCPPGGMPHSARAVLLVPAGTFTIAAE